MFKFFKFGVASVTGIFIIVGILIGIAITIIFNLYVEKQKLMNANISSGDLIESTEKIESPEELIEEGLHIEKEDSYVQQGILKLENYERLKIGLNYEETVKILGTEGKKDAERVSPHIHSVSYDFSENGHKGIDISISFVNDELSEKSFYVGVPEKSEVAITAEQFDEVKSAMTYEEVKNLLGGEGVLITDFGFPDGDYHSSTYKYDGESNYSEANFTFSEGEMASKSQFLLE